jgi:RluA family pseudouridine synthase
MPEPHELPILYLDDDLLAINKPAGLLTLPDGYQPDLPDVRKLIEAQLGPVWIVHRLDKDTSGVLLLARSAAAHREINQQFSAQQVRKTYHALVIGRPEWEHIHVEAPLRSNVGRRKRTIVDETYGKAASTYLRVLARFPQATLVEARPRSGRTHQIRAHLYAVGCPIMADPLYGEQPPDSTWIPRLALHARTLALQHPASHQPVQFSAPYPQDFERALKALAQLGSSGGGDA